jgi:hypothetical protein
VKIRERKQSTGWKMEDVLDGRWKDGRWKMEDAEVEVISGS